MLFQTSDKEKEPTEAEKQEAEKLKNTGNELMKAENYEAAVQKYTDAIKLYKSAVFFCNRSISSTIYLVFYAAYNYRFAKNCGRWQGKIGAALL